MRPVIVMITGRFLRFRGLLMRITEVGGETCNTSVNFDSGKEELSANYGSSRRNLSYFRKVGAGRRAWGAEFTEVGGEICVSPEAGRIQCELRK